MYIYLPMHWFVDLSVCRLVVVSICAIVALLMLINLQQWFRMYIQTYVHTYISKYIKVFACIHRFVFDIVFTFWFLIRTFNKSKRQQQQYALRLYEHLLKLIYYSCSHAVEYIKMCVNKLIFDSLWIYNFMSN